MKKYTLTDEHRAQLKPWADKWIANAMSVKPMDDEDRAKCLQAVKGMYKSANLNPPPDHRIVFVASPFVLRFAGGFAAAIWWLRKNAAATYAATDDATWYVCGVSGLITLANRLAGKNAGFFLACTNKAWRMWSGGNQWSGWTSFLSFFRHIAKLEIDYSKWAYWEDLTLHSGPRIMHPEFCMISDRPEILKVDEQNRPHCEDGPFCRWRDGSALYAVHGVRVPAYVIEHPEKITVQNIESEQNAEVRRVKIDRYGQSRYLLDSGAKEIHTDDFGTLYRKEIPGDEPLVMVKVVNSTPEPDGSFKDYFLRVPPTMERAQQAVAWTFGKEERDYAPCLET